MATLSAFAQMTPNMPNNPYHPSSGYSTLPYSPIHAGHASFVQSPLTIAQNIASPRKPKSMKGMSRDEFDQFVCKRIEDRVDSALSTVDSGLESLQREIQVKERLR